MRRGINQLVYDIMKYVLRCMRFPIQMHNQCAFDELRTSTVGTIIDVLLLYASHLHLEKWSQTLLDLARLGVSPHSVVDGLRDLCARSWAFHSLVG